MYSAQQGVKELAPDEVSTWPESIERLREDFSISIIMLMLYENKIACWELLALDIAAGLKIVGVKMAGTFCLAVDKIASKNIVTLIKHSLHCFVCLK